MTKLTLLPSHIEQEIKQLANQQNQPLCAYLYDLNALEQHIKQMLHVLPKNVELFYAAKANPSAPILRTLVKRIRRIISLSKIWYWNPMIFIYI